MLLVGGAVVIRGERFGPIKNKARKLQLLLGGINNIMQTHVEGDIDFLIF
jgi:hypothetical protein